MPAPAAYQRIVCTRSTGLLECFEEAKSCLEAVWWFLMYAVATVPKERTFLFSREQDRNMAEIGKPHGIQRTIIIIIAECAATGIIISGRCCCCLSLLSLVSWSWTSIRVPDCTPVVAHQVQLQHLQVFEAAADDLLLKRRRRRSPGGGIASGARHVNKCFREFDANLHCESRFQRYALGGPS